MEEELLGILGVDHLDSNDPGRFQQRNAAAKRVLEKMTEREQAEVLEIVKERRSKGNPENVRRE